MTAEDIFSTKTITQIRPKDYRSPRLKVRAQNLKEEYKYLSFKRQIANRLQSSIRHKHMSEDNDYLTPYTTQSL